MRYLRVLVFSLFMMTFGYPTIFANQEFIAEFGGEGEDDDNDAAAVINEEIRKINKSLERLSVLTTAGDILYHDGTDNKRLAIGTASQRLRVNSGATAPEWVTITSTSTVRQVVVAKRTDHIRATTDIILDDTLPQISEGTEILEVSITPEETDSTLYFEVVVNGSPNGASSWCLAHLHKNDGDDAIALGGNSLISSSRAATPISFLYDELSATTDARTYQLVVGCHTTTDYDVNGDANARVFGGAMISYLKVTEVEA